MSGTDSISRTRDISVLQLLTRMVVETERLIRLADDINQHATTPQAKSAMNLIGTEVNNILTSMKTTIDPLYNLYDIDPGLKAAKQAAPVAEGSGPPQPSNEYDESKLWTDVKNSDH